MATAAGVARLRRQQVARVSVLQGDTCRRPACKTGIALDALTSPYCCRRLQGISEASPWWGCHTADEPPRCRTSQPPLAERLPGYQTLSGIGCALSSAPENSAPGRNHTQGEHCLMVGSRRSRHHRLSSASYRLLASDIRRCTGWAAAQRMLKGNGQRSNDARLKRVRSTIHLDKQVQAENAS